MGWIMLEHKVPARHGLEREHPSFSPRDAGGPCLVLHGETGPEA